MFLDNLSFENATIKINHPNITTEIVNVSKNIRYVVLRSSFSANQQVTLSNPLVFEFNNAGHTVKGRSVDLSVKYTKVAFSCSVANSNVYLAVFNRNGSSPESPFGYFCGANTISNIWMTIDSDIELRYSDTKELVNESAQFTFADLDGMHSNATYNEGVKLGNGFTHSYVRTDHVLDKSAISSSGNTWFRMMPGGIGDPTNVDERYFACSFVKGGKASLTWYAGGRDWGTEIGAQYRGYPDWDAPTKTQNGSAELLKVKNNDTIVYDITQFFPYTAQTNQATSATISDTLPNGMENAVTSIQVIDSSGNDVSSKWNISRNGRNISANAKVPYESIGQHILRITCKIPPIANKTSHIMSVDENKNSITLSFKNTGMTTINGTSKNTNEVVATIDAYPLIYDLQGGDENSFNAPISINQAQSDGYAGYYQEEERHILTSEVPHRTGHTFIGWSESPQQTATNKSSYDMIQSDTIEEIIMPASQKIVYAAWAKNPIVTFVDNQGNVMSQQEITPGTDAIPPETERQGYIFAGWDVPYENVYEDITVTGSWTAIEYSIEYMPNGAEGDSYNTEGIPFDTAFEIADNMFSRKHYDFIGWNTELDGSGTAYSEGQEVSNLADGHGDVVRLYAQWKFYTAMPKTGMLANPFIMLIGVTTCSIAMALMSRQYHKKTVR